MRVFTLATVGIVVAGLAGCSNDEPKEVKPVSTAAQPAAAPGADELKKSAEQLDRAASSRNDSAAWGFYSKRCQQRIGDLTAYSAVLDLHYNGRTPNYTDWRVTVAGSHGEVVTIDSDPSAPANSFTPRTWTFIDGHWQFDNC